MLQGWENHILQSTLCFQISDLSGIKFKQLIQRLKLILCGMVIPWLWEILLYLNIANQ